ncbi:MBL fold metallo-hydrolase [Oligoflexus tunisiensis]|uniref:MBL fold metallo-hydrolase n=1 Tax=Oligoflexus tunisiensis TaxID=708132 RepID=UPI000ABB1C15|nr:MBL fold metallo-hydrolase [Oligoflexus tunisiensis]
MKHLLFLLLASLGTACAITSTPAQLVEVGKPSRVDAIKPALTGQGPIQFRKVVAANWAADRGGLIQLEDPKAKAAGLKNELEDIQIYFYVIDHPTFGRYLIDTGIESTMKEKPEDSPVGGMMARFMNMDKLVIHQTTRDWMRQNPGPIKGVFLTHMHLDHIMGVPDLDPTIPIFIGPEESTHKEFRYLFTRGATDDFLEGPRTLSELNFPEPAAPGEPAVIDFFGDQSLFVLSVPGHTEGSLAFVVHSSAGPQLITGDTCHTRWGWEQNVTPGEFTEDADGNRQSLDFLKQFSATLPGVQVHPGHQSATAAGKLETL